MTRIKISGKERISCIVLSILYVFGILLSTGTLFSGYHLIDDHEIIKYNYWNNMEPHSLYELLTGGFGWKWERFRPLYEIIRRIRCILFGDNLLIWSIIVALEIVLIIVCSYYFARLWGSNHFFSLIYSLLVVSGEQSAVWWRLGPQEPLGTLFLIIALLCFQIHVISDKKKWMVFGIISALLCTMIKESFTIMLPFIIILTLVFFVWNSNEEHNLKAYVDAIKRYSMVIVFCIVVFCAEIIYIFVNVGINSVGYAGIDNELSVLGYIKRMGGMLLFRFSIYFWLIVSVAVVSATYMFIKGTLKRFIFEKWDICAVSVLIILTQVFLYAKSGMFERYYLPSTIAIAMLLTITLNGVFEEKQFERIYGAIILACLLFLLIDKVIPNAISFTRIGNDFANCMEYVKAECDKDAYILAMGKADEENLGIESYMQYCLGYKHVVSYDMGSYHDKVIVYTDEIKISDNSKIEYIIADEKLPRVDGFDIEADFGSFYLMKKVI